MSGKSSALAAYELSDHLISKSSTSNEPSPVARMVLLLLDRLEDEREVLHWHRRRAHARRALEAGLGGLGEGAPRDRGTEALLICHAGVFLARRGGGPPVVPQEAAHREPRAPAVDALEEELLPRCAHPLQEGRAVDALEVQRPIHRVGKGARLAVAAAREVGAAEPRLGRVGVRAEPRLVLQRDVLEKPAERVRAARVLPRGPRRQAVPPRVFQNIAADLLGVGGGGGKRARVGWGACFRCWGLMCAAHEAVRCAIGVGVADERHRMAALEDRRRVRHRRQSVELAAHRIRLARGGDAARDAAKGRLERAGHAGRRVGRVALERQGRVLGARYQVADGHHAGREAHHALVASQRALDVLTVEERRDRDGLEAEGRVRERGVEARAQVVVTRIGGVVAHRVRHRSGRLEPLEPKEQARAAALRVDRLQLVAHPHLVADEARLVLVRLEVAAFHALHAVRVLQDGHCGEDPASATGHLQGYGRHAFDPELVRRCRAVEGVTHQIIGRSNESNARRGGHWPQQAVAGETEAETADEGEHEQAEAARRRRRERDVIAAIQVGPHARADQSGGSRLCGDEHEQAGWKVYPFAKDLTPFRHATGWLQGQKGCSLSPLPRQLASAGWDGRERSQGSLAHGQRSEWRCVRRGRLGLPTAAGRAENAAADRRHHGGCADVEADAGLHHAGGRRRARRAQPLAWHVRHCAPGRRRRCRALLRAGVAPRSGGRRAVEQAREEHLLRRCLARRRRHPALPDHHGEDAHGGQRRRRRRVRVSQRAARARQRRARRGPARTVARAGAGIALEHALQCGALRRVQCLARRARQAARARPAEQLCVRRRRVGARHLPHTAVRRDAHARDAAAGGPHTAAARRARLRPDGRHGAAARQAHAADRHHMDDLRGAGAACALSAQPMRPRGQARGEGGHEP
eukprot:scaffold57487_cov61-Phaeocystis_antarctica.AAC.7